MFVISFCSRYKDVVNINCCLTGHHRTCGRGKLVGVGQEIGKEHGCSVAMAEGDLVGLEGIGDPKITDVDVAGALASRGPAVAFELFGTLVILFEVTVIRGVALGNEKMHAPDGVREIIAGSDELSFGRGFGVDLLFGCAVDEAATAHQDSATRLAAVVGVDGVSSVEEGPHSKCCNIYESINNQLIRSKVEALDKVQ